MNSFKFWLSELLLGSGFGKGSRGSGIISNREIPIVLPDLLFTDYDCYNPLEYEGSLEMVKNEIYEKLKSDLKLDKKCRKLKLFYVKFGVGDLEGDWMYDLIEEFEYIDDVLYHSIIDRDSLKRDRKINKILN